MRTAIILAAVLFVPAFAFSATIIVPDDYPTIQGAIDAAVDGDTVLVKPGTYVVGLWISGKAITVKSCEGAGVTVLEGAYYPVIYLENSAGPDSVIEGFTITNGTGFGHDNYYGGGIYCYDSSPTITNNIITGNFATYGGGIYCGGASPIITNNVITKNIAIGGGWIPLHFGGGIYCTSNSSPTITNNTIYGNSGWGVGGIACDSSVTITNTILWNNDGDEILGSPTVNYCNVQGGYQGTGNIDADPLFIDPDSGNCHLHCLSPCVDTGDNNAPFLPDFDFEGNPRILDGNGDGMAVVDMGADEVPVLFVPSDYPTIQSAIDAALDKASILVEPGTYYEIIDFQGKAITVAGRDGHEHTVIDGCRAGSVVTFQSGEGLDSCLTGFQIMNGWATNGGGILCNGASPFLRNNHIHDNAALYGDGGGIYCLNAEPLITDNLISINAAENGGGICCNGASPVIIENTISGNTAGIGGAGVMCLECDDVTISGNVIKDNKGTDNGGGIECEKCTVLIENNTIDNNTAGGTGGGISGYECNLTIAGNEITNNYSGNDGGAIKINGPVVLIEGNTIHGNAANGNGGGICCVEDSPVMVNNILYKNQASLGGGIFSDDYSSPILTNNTLYLNSASSTGGGLDCGSGSPWITNTIFWDNYAPTAPQICGTSPLVTYCDVQGGWPGFGNIDTDPLFVDPDAEDFHLSLDSPCANVGYNHAPELPEEDFEGDPRILVIVDMGVDETGFGGGVKIRVPEDYPTIQSAIDVAMEDNTVLVAPGTYFENIDFLGKAITVKGTDGHELTVIDGSQSGSVVTFQNGEGLDSVLEGFQIVNGSAPNGGGVLCQGASPTIRKNHIKENSAEDGGGICCINAAPRVEENHIFSNTTFPVGRKGGGIYCDQSHSTIINNLIYENSARFGGGICCDDASPVILNNILFNNMAQPQGYGGGIYCTGSLSQPVISHNTVTQNIANNYGGGISSVSDASPVVTNTILWENQAWLGSEIYLEATLGISYSDVLGGQASVHEAPGGILDWGACMIDADPLFLNPLHDDYHLTFNSPCRGSGDNNAVLDLNDFEGDPRIAYGTVDMGADEFYTHLYYTGNAAPTGSVEVKFVGHPGSSPIGLWIAFKALETPIPGAYGDWWLLPPMLGPVLLGSIPANGVSVLPGALPPVPYGPYTLYLQAIMGTPLKLTNLCVMKVN